MVSTQGKPIWYELMTPDPRAIAPFYRAVTGWTVPIQENPMPDGSDYRQFERSGGGFAGGVLTLTPQMREAGTKPGWIIYFHVDDVDESVAHAVALGGTIHMPPTTMDGVGRLAMTTDPQGAPFYLMDPTPPPHDPTAQSDAFQPMAAGHCWWNELETTDEPGATAFYTALFGWSAKDAMPMGEHGDYRFIEADGQQIGAINPWMADYMSVGWLPYFGVTDINAAKAAAEDNGGTVTQDIHEVPGGDFIFTATDPAGAHVAFVGPKGA